MLLSNPSLPQHDSISPEGNNVVDTTLIFEELKRTFVKSGAAVEVDFRKIVDWVKVGDQLTHLVHPYPAKLLPHIAHFFLRCRGGASSTHVLDPFCGSGTVALEASIAGHVPLVSDANPFALLLTKVKTTPYDVEALRNGAAKIKSRAARLRKAPIIPVVNAEKWYAKDVKTRLEILLRAIREYDDPTTRDFFLVCFSAVARKVSRIDPAISVPVRLRVKDAFSLNQNNRISERLSWAETAKPIDEFFNICHANIARVAAANKAYPKRRAATTVGTDARLLKKEMFPSNGVPLIITSPPYGTAQKYIRASSLSLNWLGLAQPNQLSSLEGKSIGREHSPAYRQETDGDVLPERFERFIAAVQEKNPLRARITRQYLVELKAALQEMYRIAMPGGRIVLVIGNNEVCGETLFTDEYILLVMQDFKCKCELILVDQIKSRGLLTKRNSTASIIAREFILVFRKNS